MGEPNQWSGALELLFLKSSLGFLIGRDVAVQFVFLFLVTLPATWIEILCRSLHLFSPGCLSVMTFGCEQTVTQIFVFLFDLPVSKQEFLFET